MAQAASREHDVRQAAVDLLIATNQFDGVYHYSAPEDRGQAAGETRAALVQPIKGTAAQLYDGLPGGAPICTMTFAVVLYARDDDPIARDRMADQLFSVACNAINGKSLGGLTFRQMTWLKTWDWIKETPPERQIRCVVQADYEAPTWNDFNTSE